jgi:hypothetical protein
MGDCLDARWHIICFMGIEDVLSIIVTESISSRNLVWGGGGGGPRPPPRPTEPGRVEV